MRPLRLMVADDEPLARKHLVRCLEAVGGMEIVAVCRDGREALDAITRHRLDAVVLDVEMPHHSGLEVAQTLVRDRSAIGIVFTTAHPDFAARAFELDAVDYLVKPFDEARIARCLERLHRRRQLLAATAGIAPSLEALTRAVGLAALRGQRLMLRTAGRVKVVEATGIRYVSSEGDYCTVSLGGDSLLVRHVLKDLEAQLTGGGFLRIHRGVLINLGHLREVRPWRHGDYEFVMTDGTVFQSGPTYRLLVQRFLETPGLL